LKHQDQPAFAFSSSYFSSVLWDPISAFAECDVSTQTPSRRDLRSHIGMYLAGPVYKSEMPYIAYSSSVASTQREENGRVHHDSTPSYHFTFPFLISLFSAAFLWSFRLIFSFLQSLDIISSLYHNHSLSLLGLPVHSVRPTMNVFLFYFSDIISLDMQWFWPVA
jgi:hypothetical protein